VPGNVAQPQRGESRRLAPPDRALTGHAAAGEIRVRRRVSIAAASFLCDRNVERRAGLIRSRILRNEGVHPCR
jgi:hypothetical protein